MTGYGGITAFELTAMREQRDRALELLESARGISEQRAVRIQELEEQVANLIKMKAAILEGKRSAIEHGNTWWRMREESEASVRSLKALLRRAQAYLREYADGDIGGVELTRDIEEALK